MHWFNIFVYLVMWHHSQMNPASSVIKVSHSKDCDCAKAIVQSIEDRFVKLNVCIERSVIVSQHGYYCIKMRIPWMSIRPTAKFDTLTWLHIRVNSRGGKKPEKKGKIAKSTKGDACVHEPARRKNQRLALDVTNTCRHDFPLSSILKVVLL